MVFGSLNVKGVSYKGCTLSLHHQLQTQKGNIMISTFQRYEYKYHLSQAQSLRLKAVMETTMKLDKFGRHTINNIYFDTVDHLLIRRSLEKPVYKEKLRVRWYGAREEHTDIFIELKKKYKGIVYKRRINRSWAETKAYFQDNVPLPQKQQGQILRELDYFMGYYQNILPMLFLSYDREAYFGIENRDFRMTFDCNIACKEGELLGDVPQHTTAIIPETDVILEVKTGEGLPQWLLEFFAEEEIYRSSFSKYGRAYQEILLPQIIQQQDYALGGAVSHG